MPTSMLTTKLAAETPTVSPRPSRMRTRYCATKSRLSATPAAASDAQKNATTSTTAAR